MNRSSPVLIFAALCIAVAIVGGLFWADLWYTRARPGGNDFAVYWASARALLEFDASPYGDLAAAQAQKATGLPESDPALPGFRLDLPLYAEIIAFPFAAIANFDLARGLWLLFLEIALIGTAFLCLRLLGRARGLSFYLLPLFALVWVHAVWPLVEGNAIILAAFFAVAALEALRTERDEAAGALFALATFKFLTLGIFALFVLLWIISRRRWRFAFAYLMSLGILIAVASIFYPNWFLPFASAMLANLRGPEMVSTAKIIGGTFPATSVRFSHLLTGLSALVLLWEWWLARARDYRHMLWVACLTLTLTPFLGFLTNPQNYAVLVLPAGLVVLLVEERWGSNGRWIVVGFLGLLFAILWGIYVTTSNPSQSLLFPAPLLLTIALYWVRWWAIRPPRTWVETVENSF